MTQRTLTLAPWALALVVAASGAPGCGGRIDAETLFPNDGAVGDSTTEPGSDGGDGGDDSNTAGTDPGQNPEPVPDPQPTPVPDPDPPPIPDPEPPPYVHQDEYPERFSWEYCQTYFECGGEAFDSVDQCVDEVLTVIYQLSGGRGGIEWNQECATAWLQKAERRDCRFFEGDACYDEASSCRVFHGPIPVGERCEAEEIRTERVTSTRDYCSSGLSCAERSRTCEPLCR